MVRRGIVWEQIEKYALEENIMAVRVQIKEGKSKGTVYMEDLAKRQKYDQVANVIGDIRSNYNEAYFRNEEH